MSDQYGYNCFFLLPFLNSYMSRLVVIIRIYGEVAILHPSESIYSHQRAFAATAMDARENKGT
jgi:hypothetical protein